ncbi:MAG: methylenetetrahydrofolate dehydrogenase (NADP+)/methenyltetrahydrofolate cyclohydrolase, partial [Psychrobacter okhotskensis]
CTPQGIMHLLAHHGIELAGKEAVVVGRSAILGKPMAMMLLNANCTVTICHSRTQDLAAHIQRADIVVGAVGVPELIQAAWIKAGAVVIDAGFHPTDNGGVGDIEMQSVESIASAYTPVPGGVGPMTINTLSRQTVDAAEKAAGLDIS